MWMTVCVGGVEGQEASRSKSGELCNPVFWMQCNCCNHEHTAAAAACVRLAPPPMHTGRRGGVVVKKWVGNRVMGEHNYTMLYTCVKLPKLKQN